MIGVQWDTFSLEFVNGINFGFVEVYDGFPVEALYESTTRLLKQNSNSIASLSSRVVGKYWRFLSKLSLAKNVLMGSGAYKGYYKWGIYRKLFWFGGGWETHVLFNKEALLWDAIWEENSFPLEVSTHAMGKSIVASPVPYFSSKVLFGVLGTFTKQAIFPCACGYLWTECRQIIHTGGISGFWRGFPYQTKHVGNVPTLQEYETFNAHDILRWSVGCICLSKLWLYKYYISHNHSMVIQGIVGRTPMGNPYISPI